MTSGDNNFNYFPENRTSLMLHFLPYAKKFQSSKEGAWPKWPNELRRREGKGKKWRERGNK